LRDFKWKGNYVFDTTKKQLFVCVGVMYSGEYDVCGVTLIVHPHRGQAEKFA
jgi:hypothetical protein